MWLIQRTAQLVLRTRWAYRAVLGRLVTLRAQRVKEHSGSFAGLELAASLLQNGHGKHAASGTIVTTKRAQKSKQKKPGIMPGV